MLAHRRSNEQPKQFFEVFVLIKLDIVLLILVMLFILSLKKVVVMCTSPGKKERVSEYFTSYQKIFDAL